MYRWHRRTCRKPDISIVDDVIFCSSCDTIAEPPDRQLSSDSVLSAPKDDHQQSLGLQWPLSIQYSTEGVHNTDNSQRTPESINANIRQSDKRNSGESYMKGDTPEISPNIDGSFYPPLAQKYDIRLLRLSALPSSGHLHGELDLVDLIYCPAFEALSYTWAGETGNNTKPRSIFIGPHWDIIPITVNCDLALRLLLSKGHMSVWIDSICINQQNPRERSHQVSIMREIYSKASQVIVYLGPAADYSDDAIDALNRFSRLEVLHESTYYQLSNSERLGLKHLFKRRYFFRIWVIQEIAMANGLTLYCGDKGVSWAALSAIRIPYRYLRTVPWLLQYVQGGSSGMVQPKGLLQLLDATSNCAASDPKDNVFAVLGLLRDGIFEGLIPDYCLSTERVYIGIASYLILRHSKTEILSYPKSRSKLLPTWVPDWSIYRPPNIPSDEEDLMNEFTLLADPHGEAGGNRVRKGVKFNPFCYEDYPHFKLHYSKEPSTDRTGSDNIIWLQSGETSWTLFTTKQERSLRIGYFSKQLEGSIDGNPFNEKPGVDTNTGALNIQSNIVTSFESFHEVGTYEFRRILTFPGVENDFEWLVKTENSVIAELDIVVYIPGSTSYLHLRRDPINNCYSLLGNCRIGFRQGPARTVPWNADMYKFGIASLQGGRQVADIDIFGMGSNGNILCASYGFDRSFLQFLDDLLQSSLGKFVVSYIEGKSAHLRDLQMSAMNRYLTDEMGISEIWKTTSGWRTSIRGAVIQDEIKTACNMLTEQLGFWSRSTTWQVIDAIEVCMKSIGDMEQMRSDWNQIAKCLASIERDSLSWKACGRPDMASSVSHKDYVHDIEPQIAIRLGLPAHSASISTLIAALKRSTLNLKQQLEFESDLLDRSIPGVDIEPETEQLSSVERVQVGRIYTHFIRSNIEVSEGHHNDPLITLGPEAFNSKVQSRIATLKWLNPSWQSYRERLMEFRQICQHIRAIGAFQESIGQAQRIMNPYKRTQVATTEFMTDEEQYIKA
ncbi:HET-domain-containing protein [Hypoxylon sp. EC38]|nr:HET-domain-containing protein [Hypoxylon sp. EC38]